MSDAAEVTAVALVATEPEKPRSLYSLLQLLTEADDEFEALALEDQVDLLEGGKLKVDNYKFLIDKLVSHAAFMKKRKDEYAAAEKSAEGNARRLKDHLIFALQANGFEKFTGHQFVVKLSRAAPSVEVSGEPTAAMKIKYDQFIKTKYEWDRVAIRSALISEDPAAAELGKLKETKYVKFSVVKGI